MASIRTAIELHDVISSPLMHISNALNMTISSFEEMQSTANNSFDSSNFDGARMEIEAANSAMDEMIDSIRRNEEAQERFNDEIQNGNNFAENLGSTIKKVVGAFVGIAAVRKSINWIQDSLDLTNVQTNAERQLQTVLRNVGATDDAFQSLKNTAASIQGYSLYGDESMIGGAAELSTYIKDTQAIESMMGTLANYAAGMSGGGEVNAQQMVDYATQLGKALDGTYDGLRKKGFELSEVQKQIIENGTDMEKALVLDEVINQSWAGLAEQMANTPQGQLIQMQNTFGDIREEVGAKLYPAVLSFFKNINSNMPEIQSLLMGFATGVQYIIFAINGVIEAATAMYGFISDNWSIISPIIYGIITALLIYAGYLAVINGLELISNGIKIASAIASYAHAAATGTQASATAAATVAQYGFNAALLACPLTWIILAILAIIAVIYMAVAAFNKFAGTSVSATGIIMGAFAVAGAFIGNIFIGFYNLVLDVIAAIWNWIAGFAEFFANVFNDPVGSILRLFANMADSILGVLQGIAKVIDAVFGSNLSESVQGWRSTLDDMVTDLVGEAEIKIPRMDTSSLYLDRIEYGSAWDAGYAFGEGVEDTIKNFDIGSLFGSDLPDPNDFAGGSVPSNIADIASNTGAIKDSINMTSEELKYLRDLAEQETVNRFTTAEIKVDMPVNANISNNMDLDGVVAYLGEGVNEAMEKAAEGVHV